MKKKSFSFLLVVLIVGLLVGLYGYKKIFGANVTKSYELKIPSGSTYEDVLGILQKDSLLQDEKMFDFLALKMNYPNNVRSGNYSLKKGMSNRSLLVKLRGGLQTPVPFILNKVTFKEDLAGLVGNSLEIDSLTMINFLTSNDEDGYKKHGFNEDNIMTAFIPNTYELYWNMNFDAFVERMIKEKKSFWNESRTKKAEKIGLTPDEVFVLASIIEKEFKHTDEIGKIARVYINRLNINMALQADPTLLFAIHDFSIRRVLNIHKEIESPYNTYKYPGLPPGPICLPSVTTINAVLDAPEHNYLYFCAKPDFSGYHNFASTLSKHNENARIYQQALNQKKIFE